MNRNKRRYFIPCLTVLMLAIPVCPTSSRLEADQKQADKTWDAFQYLIGSWVGEGGGTPGQGSGSFNFNLDLGNKVLVRKNHSEYPATKDRAAFAHDDLMVIYPEFGKHPAAIYFDNEGHVINYDVAPNADGSNIVFVSDTSSTMPQFRLTYVKLAQDTVNIKFEIAPPGQTGKFMPYTEGKAIRKQ